MNDISLACFLSVARTGSFTTSATDLSSTQQAVSRNVLSLEEELGFTLLDRSGRTVELTPEGERFFRWCLDLDRQLALTASAAQRITRRSENTLRIGWCDWTGCPEPLHRDIDAFRSAYPACEMDFRQDDLSGILTLLREKNLDLAVLPEIYTHNLPDIAVSRPFMDLPLYIISGRPIPFYSGHLNMPELTPIKQLVPHFGDDNDEAVRSRAEYLCTLLGIYPEYLQIMPNVDSVLTELVCGPCYSIMPKTPAAERMGALTFEPLDLPLPLVFARTHGSPLPWVSLFENFIENRRRSDEQ